MSANATSSVQTQATTSTQASSSPTTSSTSDAPTSATPTTEATTASPAQSSTGATQASPTATSSPVASSSLASSAGSATTNTSVFTTQVATTLLSTDAAGSTIYITTTTPETTSAVSSGSGSSGGTSHTAAIVGGVVGGVVGLALLVLLVFCIRRRNRKDEFDGNFDPDRIGGSDPREGTLPQVDLAEEVTPFPQSYTDQGSSSMRQFGESPSVVLPSSAASGQASAEFYPHGVVGGDAQPLSFTQPGASGAYVPPMDMYGTGPADWHNPRPGASPPPSTVSNNTSSARAAKEREALGREQGTGLGLATQPEAPEGSEVVVVHQDAGRAPTQEHAPPPREIPPAYDSIRRD